MPDPFSSVTLPWIKQPENNKVGKIAMHKKALLSIGYLRPFAVIGLQVSGAEMH